VNNCSFVGRVGKDAVTRFTQAGKAVTGWSLAIDKGWGDNKQTIWLDCTLWGERGEKIAPNILKGDRLGVVGELGTREHDGKTYVTLDVRDVTLLGNKPASSPDEGRGHKPAGKPQPARREPAPSRSEDTEDTIPF
jgi:single-strand DNA-binding protein